MEDTAIIRRHDLLQALRIVIPETTFLAIHLDHDQSIGFLTEQEPSLRRNLVVR